jgi:hypothetical protein
MVSARHCLGLSRAFAIASGPGRQTRAKLVHGFTVEAAALLVANVTAS